MKSLSGGCFCGAIRYEIPHEILDAAYCHCSICRRTSGAPVVAWLTIPVASFQILSGRPTIFRSSPKAERQFCGTCGTQLTFCYSDHPKTLDVSIASLDRCQEIEPRYHIWTQSQIPWFRIEDDFPRYEDRGIDTWE